MIMNRFTFLILGIIITFLSCDGRDKVNRTPIEVLKEKNLFDAFSQRVTFYPKDYSEVKTDTIFNNGDKISIKTYTDMERTYLNEFTHDSITYKYHYRDFKASIEAIKNGIVVQELIDREFILKYDKSLSNYMETSILKSVWVDQENCLNTNKIVLNILFTQPKSNTTKLFELTIDEKGKYKLVNLTDANANYLTA